MVSTIDCKCQNPKRNDPKRRGLKRPATRSVVAHKYTPSEMSERELDATFAARGHTVDYLLKSLRDQIKAGTLSSFVVTGPRGAWMPVAFPEEQFSIVSLRDFLSAILRELAAGGQADAKAWLEKVEAESN